MVRALCLSPSGGSLAAKCKVLIPRRDRLLAPVIHSCTACSLILLVVLSATPAGDLPARHYGQHPQVSSNMQQVGVGCCQLLHCSHSMALQRNSGYLRRSAFNKQSASVVLVAIAHMASSTASSAAVFLPARLSVCLSARLPA